MNIRTYHTILPNILVLSAFGIYLGSAIRVEHLIIYPAMLIFFILSISSKHLIVNDYFKLLFLWTNIIIIAILVTIFNFEERDFLKVLADIESVLQPLAIMFLFIFLFIGTTIHDITLRILNTCKLLIMMLSLNTIIILISTIINITEILKYFWNSNFEWSVAELAMTNGRYSGIFNQPMESGVMYSIGLFAWLYINEKEKIINFTYTFILNLLLIGGIYSVSKIFLFGGLILFLFGIFLNRAVLGKIFYPSLLTTIFGYVAYYYLLKNWTGLDYLLRFIGSNDGIVNLITSGRYGGDNSQQSQFFYNLFKESPIYGRGFGVTEVYDSGYYFFFAISGSIGVAILIIVLASLLVKSFKFIIQNSFQAESKFFLYLTILILGSSFGSPVMTLNRTSIVLWVFMGLLYQYSFIEKYNLKKNIKGE